MEPFVVGERVGTACPTVFGTIVEVHSDHVVVDFTDGKKGEHYYLWEQVRWRVGPINSWSIFEDWCHRLTPLERMAHEID
jgi:hypothetical protein